MRFNFWNLKQWLVFGAIFVVSTTVVWFGYKNGYFRQYIKNTQSHQVSGVLKSVDGNQLIIFGSHINDSDINKAEDFSKRQDLTIVTDPDTKFIKSVWHVPMTKEYFMENKININLIQTQKEKVAGSIDDFKDNRGLAMIVRTENNSLNETTLKAAQIEYTIIVYSK